MHTPFDPNHENECKLGTTLAISEQDLPKYEDVFHVEFRHTIGQSLHVQQWVRPGISFAVARLASFNTSPNVPACQNLKCLMRYISSFSRTDILPSTSDWSA